MKTSILLLVLSLVPALARAESPRKSGDIGAGVIVGDPTGLTGKFWLDKNLAVDAVLGFNDGFSMHSNLLWHIWDLLPQPSEGALPLYLGGGVRFEPNKHNTEFGFRAVAGAAYYFPKHPLELFAEVAPVFEVNPDTEVGFDFGVGLRVYFGK